MNGRTHFKKVMYLGTTALSVLLFCGCITQKYVSIEQMVPPTFLLPDGVRRLGILNNCSLTNITKINDDIDLFEVNRDSVVEYIAMGFADSGVFDDVVVLDSCIVPPSDTTGSILSQEQVIYFCDTMQVDMLYVCDYAGLSSYNKDTLTAYGIDFDTAPRNYYLLAHAYAPSRTKPMHTYIFQEPLEAGMFRTKEEVLEVEHKTYPLWSELATHSFTPQWDRRERSFYSGSTYELREAKVCVRDGDWDGARRWWHQLGQKRKDRFKIAAAYNEALWFEMHDSIDEALDKLQEARTFVSDTTALDSASFWQWYLDAEYYGLGEYPYTDYQRILNYERILQDRQAEVQKLNLIHLQ